MIPKLFASSNGGLGDQLIMNGGLRWLADEGGFEEIVWLAMTHHREYRQIVRMYSDHPRINVRPEPKSKMMSQATKKLVKLSKRYPDWHIRAFSWAPNIWEGLAHDYGLHPQTNCWPELFYTYIVGGANKDLANYGSRYTHWHVHRDKDREKDLLRKLDLPSKYIFVADKGSNRRYWVNMKPISQYAVVNPDFWLNAKLAPLFHDEKYSIFDWIPVLENAEEIYTIDTAWFHLIKNLRLDKPKFFFNHIGRPMKDVIQSNYLNDEWDNGWKVIHGPGLEVKGLGARGDRVEW